MANDVFGSPSGSAFREKMRQELLNWFRRNAESLADAYEGAIRLLVDRDFPGRVHFIAHAVRDIADRLAFVLDPQLTPRRVQYEHHMDGILKLWPKLQVIADTGDGTFNQGTMTIDFRVASLI